MPRDRYIRASEVGEYVYCRRAWWLHHIEGLEPDGRQRRERGTALHTRHGRQVQASYLLLIMSLVLAALAVALLFLR